MRVLISLITITAFSFLSTDLSNVWARGFGGGGFRGGGGGFHGGGGFSGGGARNFGGGNFGGGNFGGGNFGGGRNFSSGNSGGRNFSGGNFGGGNFGGGNLGGGRNFNGGNLGGGNSNGSRFSNYGSRFDQPGRFNDKTGFDSNFMNSARSGDRLNGGSFNRPNGGNFNRNNLNQLGGGRGLRNDGSLNMSNMNFNQRPTRQGLNNFLGLPSDAGHNAVTNSHPSVQDFTGRNTVNSSIANGSGSGNIYHGANGGIAGEGSYTGPRGNTISGGGAIGPNGGHAAGGTISGNNGGSATGGRVVGPGGGSAAGGKVVGPDGGSVAGGRVTGPGGGSAAGGRVVGPNGGTAAGGRVVGPGGGSAAGGRVVGPNGNSAAGGVVRGPGGGAVGGGVVHGPNGGYAAGFVHVPPSTRYYHGAMIRGGFYGWGMYSPGWYSAHPGVWYASTWPPGYAWRVCTWGAMVNWFAWSNMQPVYYDYGNNVVYQDNSVYVNNQDVGTAEEYTQQASQLAQAGASADVSQQEKWMPLGVFALSPSGGTKSNSVVELAVNKDGILRGNFTDTKTKKSQQIQGSVDKKTQRAAWTVGDDKNTVYDTGIYNLTKSEAPLLVHIGKKETQQWLMVRLDQKDKDDSKTSAPGN